MPTLVGSSPGTGARIVATDSGSVTRLLVTVYARERLEDVIRGVAEDALSPSMEDAAPWQAEASFDDDLARAVRDIAASTNLLLVERLSELLETAPPSVRGRMSSVPRYPEQA
jgi:hypothetical protein